MPWESDLNKIHKSNINNKVIRIKEKINLSSLTKKQEKIFTKKYGDCIFNDNSTNFISRSIFFRKMFERENQKKTEEKIFKNL